MKRRLLLLIVGFVLFVAFLLLLWPARVAVAWFAPPGVTLTGVTGTIWAGGASQLAIGDTPLGQISWTDGSLAAFIGRPSWRVDLKRGDGFARGDLHFTAGGLLRIDDLDAVGSLASLEKMLPIYGTRGNLTVRIEQFRMSEGQIRRISGRVVVDSIVPPGLKTGDLGTLEAVFPGDEAAPLEGTLSATGGPIQVRDGRIRLQADGSYEVEGRVSAKDDAPEEISNALNFLGRPDAEGFRPFSQAGSI